MIKITTDSTSDLPQSILEEYDITVLPLGIIKGGQLFRDGIDITTRDIVDHVDGGGEITTTNAVNIADYEETFKEYAPKYDAVIHFNIGSGFSSCHQNAKIPAGDYDNVYVIDTANLSVGQGLLVLAAAEAARNGKSAQEIVAMLEDMIPRVEMSFVLDRLDYMKKGGRCSTVVALGANLLKLHPRIDLVNGKLGVAKKYRGSIEKSVADYMKDQLAGRDDIDPACCILVDACFDDSLASIARKYLAEDGRFEKVIEAKAGSTIMSHCGPGTLGIVFLRK